jgi:hypothetical protein
VSTAIPETVVSRILMLRGQRVMLDADLAELYGVTTKRLNEQVKRNIERFPGDFMFQLNVDEKSEVVANCDHLGQLKYSSSLPYVFTEHGALMLGNVLKSSRAVRSQPAGGACLCPDTRDAFRPQGHCGKIGSNGTQTLQS